MYRKQTRIPTLIALAIVIFGIGGGIFLVETSQTFTLKADSSIVPSNIRITNISDSSFTVSWLTAKEATGYVLFWSESRSRLTAFDDRDTDGRLKKYITHHVTIKNLKENTIYSFEINSNGRAFNNAGKPYSQATALKLSTTTNLDPSYGVILTTDNSPATGTVVYLTVGKSQPLSTLVKTAGTWLIPLNNLYSQDLFTRPEIADDEIIQIQAVYTKNLQLAALTDTKNDSPVPTMTLGKTYDFRNIQAKAPVLFADNQNKVLGESNLVLNRIDFVFPKNDGDTTSDVRAEIRGVGIPGRDTVILINSIPQQSGKVIVAKDGTWSFKPKTYLNPGKLTVNITTEDDKGKAVSLSRSFIVLKSGQQVLGESTPSATLAPTDSFLPSPTVPFDFPTATPTPIVAGNSLPTYGFLAFGMFLLVLGIKFLVF
ncbi:fibronectin type III domain-containing protein [Candidatus Gottesmanbacteria bacterium]|nr:fibronectin type III domain-containing protein [Candidatus Gottesmanbacteria bacterium]